MKAYISFSLNEKDEYILTLLSFILKENNIESVLNKGYLANKIDITTQRLIEESSIFIGIALNDGGDKKKLIIELDHAINLKIPFLLIAEEGNFNKSLLKYKPLIFDRSKAQKTIYDIERLMNELKSQSNESNNAFAWLLAGPSIIATINGAFKTSTQNISKFVINGRLKLIEHQLITIDSAAFQNLCDLYLIQRDPAISSINRTGSQLGKQKTTKGTPDTFYRLTDGSLRYVEFTTKADGLVKKIKDDIDKCLDASITGVPIHKINKLIIFFNSRISVAEETEIIEYARSKKIRIELIGLDWLALEIYSKYLILAKDILNIPLDTGQLLPLTSFIEEYNNKGGQLSTPLDNDFLHRKAELAEIERKLSNTDILIISGFPGVGKTKLALECINHFLEINSDYVALAISKKDQDISNDLKIHLQQQQDCILLVDDANRQLINFKQILGLFKEKRKGNIKLVITVRDYAITDVINECFEFDPYKITLNKFSDAEITDLISSDSFGIKNSRYQQRIIEVADGNARLAVMAARIAKQRQELFLLGDVSDLYDSYFQTFIKDFDIFGNKALLKTLGIIAFFFTIDRVDKEYIDLILKKFNIDYHEFNEAIDELERRELVEVQFSHVRVSEQVMATYFFYKVFIKDEILSFKTLLFTFFNNYKNRFSDTVIPSNNSFGYNNVLKKIDKTLDEYLYSITEDEKILDFLSLFWFYKRDETLEYFTKKIKALPEPINQNYTSSYELNDFVHDRNKTLTFLSDFFRQYSNSFKPALELAFEYCRKKPESLPELTRRIKETLIFEDEDHGFNFQRQTELFQFLIKKIETKQPHYIEAFFSLANTFLAHTYRVTKGGRNHSITFYQYPLPFYAVTQNFRRLIWVNLFNCFDEYPLKILSFIKDFKSTLRDSNKDILAFDLSFIIPFIESKLNPEIFDHIYIVQDFVDTLDRKDIDDRTYQRLKSKFISKEYEYFRKLDWNTLRGKQDYEYDAREDFYKLKEQDVRGSCLFSSERDFNLLHSTIKNSIAIDANNKIGIFQSLDIIVEENFRQNDRIGFALLASILNNYPMGLNPLNRGIKAIVSKSKESAIELWAFFKDWNHNNKLFWQLAFFDYLPKEFIDEYYTNELLEVIKSISTNCYLQFESFEKFAGVNENIILNILEIAVDKIKKEGLLVTLSFHFFEKYSSLLSENINLLTEAYILQERKVNKHFDFNNAGLKALLEIKPEFLIEYINEFYCDKSSSYIKDRNEKLPFVWDLNINNLVEKAINLIVDNTPYYGFEHPIIIFFNRVDLEQEKKAKEFILNYIEKYNLDINKMNALFSVLRDSMAVFFETAFLHFLSYNWNIEDFKKIHWISNGRTYSGDVVIGEVRAKDWQKILEFVDKLENQLDAIEIKVFIKKQISYELRSGDEERKRKFINPERW